MTLKARATMLGGVFVLGMMVGLALAARLGRTEVRT